MSWRMSRGSGGVRARTSLCALGLLLLVLPGCQAFMPNFLFRVLTLSWDSYTHQYMTEHAVLNVTMETLSRLPGHHFSKEQTGLGRGFWRSVGEVVHSNVYMDFLSSTRSDPVYHFDSERVEDAMVILRMFRSETLLLVGAKDYKGARHSLGQLLHSLQDFYSHSNWVEMGQRSIYLHLLNPREPAVPVASEDTPTCAECHSATCRGNLLPELTQGQRHPLLTTGYFSTNPPKPSGKCSHGGVLDSSRHQEAHGGINKDSNSPLFSPHHYLHKEAARLATMATLTVLRDLRDTVGPTSFLRLFSVRQLPALVFVMDTTGSMFEEITAARRRALSIIQARAQHHAPGLPGIFLLVPFNDPEVGPVYETDDPEQFLRRMEELSALKGGDEPEMCLSAIQLALTHSPPLSEIFVFTDASPKDAHLYNAVKALTLEKQSKVTFLLTEDPNHRGREGGMRRRRREILSPDRFSLYCSLSSVSGGLTIFTTNTDIERVSVFVQDSTTINKVTLLRVESESDSESSHAFQVDSAMRNVTLHLTGVLRHCVLESPTGGSQSLLGPPGHLAELERFQGLYRISLLPPIEPGQWRLSARAQGHVTFSAIGDSSLDFLYYIAVEANETHPGLARVEGSPVAGVPTFLVLAITGLSPNEEASFSHVTLLGANGESLQRVGLNSSSPMWSPGEELVGRMDSVPRVPFCVRLTGRDGRGNSLERVSTEMIQPTHVQIQVLSKPHLVPGYSSTVDFDVWNHGPARQFMLSAEDDRGYLSQTAPPRLSIGERGSVRGEVKLTTPKTTEAGVAITLTLTVKALDSLDSNYAVVHLSVIPLDADMLPPSCSVMRVEMACPPQCAHSSWSVSLVVTDKGRSGLAAIQLSQGQGTLSVLHVETTEHQGSLTQLREGTTRHQGPPTQLHEETTGHRKGPEHGGHRRERGRLVQDDSPLNVTEWAGGKPLQLHYTSGCCSPQAELQVWDGAGNMRRCRLTSSQQRARPERNSAAGWGGEILLGLLLLSLLGTAAV